MSESPSAFATNAQVISPSQTILADMLTWDEEGMITSAGGSAYLVLTVDPRSIVAFTVQPDDYAFELRRQKIRELILTNPLAVVAFTASASFAYADAFGGAHIVSTPFWIAAAIVMFGVAGSGVIYLRRLCP